jgi:hypothetical protein
LLNWNGRIEQNEIQIPTKRAERLEQIAPSLLWDRISVFVKQAGEKFVRRLKLKSNKGGDPTEWPAELPVRQAPLPVAAVDG